MRKIIVAVAAMAAMGLAVPALASASYTISERTAAYDAMDAAEYKYDAWGVTADHAACRPQGVYKPRSYWRKYTWHRWVCRWVGYDANGAQVLGWFRITGHAGDGNYGYLPLYGGLRWT